MEEDKRLHWVPHPVPHSLSALSTQVLLELQGVSLPNKLLLS